MQGEEGNKILKREKPDGQQIMKNIDVADKAS